MKRLFDEMNHPVRHRWMSLVQGVIYVVVGLYIMLTPMVSYVALSFLFSVSVMLNGILEIMYAASNRHSPNWGWHLGGGVIDLLIGLFLVVYPFVSVEVIPILMAFWLLFRGLAAIGDALDMKRFGAVRCVTYTVLGVLAVVSALFILWQPVVGALYVIYIVALAFMVIGVYKIGRAFEGGKPKRTSASDDDAE